MDSQIKKYAYLCSGKQLKSGKMNKCQLLLSFPVVFLLVACGGKPQQPEPPSLMEASRQELATALGERDELLSMV